MLFFHLQAKFFGCPIEFDSVLCWPATAPNSSSILPCFTEFLGINYDGSRKYYTTLYLSNNEYSLSVSYLQKFIQPMYAMMMMN